MHRAVTRRASCEYQVLVFIPPKFILAIVFGISHMHSAFLILRIFCLTPVATPVLYIGNIMNWQYVQYIPLLCAFSHSGHQSCARLSTPRTYECLLLL